MPNPQYLVLTMTCASASVSQENRCCRERAWCVLEAARPYREESPGGRSALGARQDGSGQRTEVESLRDENARLRQELEELKQVPQKGFSRKILLQGGGAALAASAGYAMLGPVPGAIAAPATLRNHAVPNADLGGSSLLTRFYVQIVGSQQGRLVGDLDGDGLPDLIVGHKISSRVSTARDEATGQATRKRQHAPFIIVKEWGASSPQLMRALATNENLLSVSIYLPKQLGQGSFGFIYQIQLQNALVASFQQYIGDSADESEASTRTLEEVTFTYQKITWTSIAGKTSFEDDWQAPIT